jgi:hypothetical protein
MAIVDIGIENRAAMYGIGSATPASALCQFPSAQR